MLRDLRIVALAALSAFALCSAWPAGAGTNQFTLVGPWGGHIHKVLFHPANPLIVYALTAGGYYRSTDAAQTWHLAEVGDLLNPPQDLAVDPSDPDRVLFAAPGEPPLLSTDSGATLARVSGFPSIPVGVTQIEFSADGSAAYASAGVRIFRSLNGGIDWSERTPVTANAASSLAVLRVDPLDPAVVYVYDAIEHGLRSTDGGATWDPFNLPESTFDLAITSTMPQRLWVASAKTGVQVSEDGGATWPVRVTGAAFAIALDPQNQSVVYASVSPDGLFRTADGNGWANVQGDARIGTISSVDVNPLDSTTLILGGTAGIAVGIPETTGVGGSWERRDQGIFATNASTLAAVPGSGRIYINTINSGVHFLADGAAAAAPVNNDALQEAAAQHAAAPASTFGLLAQARGTDRLFVGIGSGGYMQSDDGGETWQARSTGGVGAVSLFADSPGHPDLIVASTFPGLQRSIDGGDTWTPTSAGLPAQAQAKAMVFSSATPDTVYAGIESADGGCCTQHGVYKSSDGGASWSAANTGFAAVDIQALAVDPIDAQIVYAAANTVGLLKSTNGGATWSRLDWPNPSGLTLAVAVDPDVPDIVYVGGTNSFARSVDAGLTWQTLRSDTARPRWQASALLGDPRRAATLLLSTHSQGVAEITIAPDLALQTGGAAVGPLEPGAQASYRYRMLNLGEFHATRARTVVTLPADATGISATITNGSCVVEGSTVTCTASVLEAAAAADIVVTATHPEEGTVEVLASVSGDQPDPVATNDEVRSTVVVAEQVSSPPPAGGGGGGGGASSWLLLLVLATLKVLKQRSRSTLRFT